MYRQRKYINYLLKTNFCTELPQKSVKKQLFDRFLLKQGIIIKNILLLLSLVRVNEFLLM